MTASSESFSPYEKFGFALLDRAFGGPVLQPWENDYARIFWQCLEVYNGGFEQWVGNTGKAGVIETLDALQRCSLLEVRRITKQASQLLQLDSYDEKTSLNDHLNNAVVDGRTKLRELDEAYWDECEYIHKALKGIYKDRVQELQ